MSLTLRIRTAADDGGEGIMKTIRFAWNCSIYEACQIIREKTVDPTNEGGRDHALFLSDYEDTPQVGQWMGMTRTLESYDLKQNDILWFRKKHFLVKVGLADGSVKTVLVDLTEPVRDFLPAVSKKAFLKNIDEYSFKVSIKGDPKKKEPNQEVWVKSKVPFTKQYPTSFELLLRKRFYLLESVLDKNDAFQIHLAYVQAKEELLGGNHPITKEECGMFGGLQAVMEHGGFNETQYKAGRTPLNLKAWLPSAFANSSMEKEVLQQWKNFSSLDAEGARVRFMQLMQTLRTYGYNLYRVQVMQKEKKKYFGMMLGFNDKNVVRMSEDCKVIVKETPLMHLKKWTFDETNIILDFGEYEMEPFVAMTPQNREISDLIGGYIDIILKKMKVRASGEEEDDAVAEETSIGSVRGNLSSGFTSSLSSTGVPQLNMQQIVDFMTGATACMGLNVDVDKLFQIFAEGMKVSMNEDQIFSQIRSHASALMNMIPPALDSVLAADVGKQLELAKKLASQMASLMSSANMAAFGFNLDPDQQRRLLLAAHSVNNALVKYMQALEELKKDPKNPKLLAAAEAAALGVESAILAFTALATGQFLDESQQALLLELARNVQTAVVSLSRTAEGTSKKITPELTGNIAHAEGSADGLIECASYLGGLTGDDSCKKKLIAAMDNVEKKSGSLMTSAGPAQCDMASCGAWKKEVDTAVEQMRAIVNCPKFEGSKEYLAYLTAANAILEETANIMNTDPLSMETATQASSVISKSYPILIAYAKQMAQSGDDVTRDRAIENSQAIHTNARAIAGTVDDATNSGHMQSDKLKNEASNLNNAVQKLLAESGNEAAKIALIDSAKVAAQTSISLIRATNKLANGSGRNSSQALLQAAADATASVQSLTQAIVGASSSEGDVRTSLARLLEVSEWFCPSVTNGIVQPVRGTVENMQDDEDRRGAITATVNEMKALNRLQKSVATYQTVGHYNNIEWASEGFRAALAELEWTEMALEVGELPKRTDVSVEQALQGTTQIAASFGQSIKGISNAAKANQQMQDPVLDLSNQCQKLVLNVKNLVAASKYNREQKTILDAGRALMNEVNRLINSIKVQALNPSDQHFHQVTGSLAASAVALQKLSRTAKQLEGAPLAEGESEANLPKSDIALEEKAKELLEKLCLTADRATVNVKKSLQDKRDSSAPDDPKAAVQVAVLEAMGALISTASNVVQASAAAQAELVSSLSTPATRAMYARDPSMAQGLVEACGQVNMAISALSTGDISVITQHELIEQAEGLAKACEVLAFATRAGTRSANSASAKRIMDAAKQVSDAVKTLLEAAKQVEDVPDVDETNVEDFGIDPATLAEIRQMMKIVDLEKQLIKAKKDLDRLENQSKTAKEWNQ